MSVCTNVISRMRGRSGGRARGAALCAALCCLGALVHAAPAAAEPAAGTFAWPAPWLSGSVDTSYTVALVPGPAGTLYAAGNTGFGQMSSTGFVARIRAADGRQTWRVTRSGMTVAGAVSGSSGDVVVAGSKGGDIVVAKYRPNGSIAWATRWGSATLVETALSVALGPDGSVYVGGLRASGASGKDGLLVAVSPSGHVRWRRLEATAGDDAIEAVTTDALGNVYVTGGRAGADTHSVWATSKFSPRGRRLWTFTVTFSRLGIQEHAWGRWLRVKEGSLYVAGQRGTSAAGRFAALRLSLRGAQRWVRSYALPAPALLESAAVDAAGRLYLVGSVLPADTPGVTQLGALVVTRADGVMAWQEEFEDVLGDFPTSFSRVSVDGLGRASCSGTMATAPGNLDYAAVVVRYKADASVDAMWRWDGGAGGVNGFGPLLRSGALYVGGQATVAAGSRAIVARLK